MLEGGVPIVVDGQVIGAVGVSGVKSGQDAQIASAGIASLSPPASAEVGERPAFPGQSRTNAG
jgi:glc operon protein GlcG